MKKMQKGSRTYLSEKKKRQFLYVLLCFLIAVIIFVAGYYLNKKSNANVFTILAILMVLPGAKFFTTAVILLPFHDAEKEGEERLQTICLGEGKLLASIVFTSPERVMNMDFLWIGDGYVYGCMGSVMQVSGIWRRKRGLDKKRQDLDTKKQAEELSYMQEYLSKGVHNYSDHYQVKIYKSIDGMAKAMKSAQPRNCTQEEQDAVRDYLFSLII